MSAPNTSTIAWHEITQRLGYVELFEHFADGAAERDVTRRLIHEEVAALKQRRFGAVRLPQELGGQGISLPELLWLIRDLATADPNIAHIWRNHFITVERHLLTQEVPFSQTLIERVGNGKVLGVAFNEETNKAAGSVGRVPQTSMQWSEAQQGWLVSGVKIYSTGNIYSDYLFSVASNPDTGKVRQFFVSTNAPGITLDDDWDGFGQKLTGSGNTRFDNVLVREGELFDLPGRGNRNSLALLSPNETEASHRTTDTGFYYSATAQQIYLTTVISGIVNRVFADAVALVRKRTRNFYHGLAELPSQEPQIQAGIGRIAAYRSAVNAVTDRAIEALDQVWLEQDDTLAARKSMLATVAASEAKVVTDEVAANLASLLIDLASGSGVSATAALDRHWRNIKVIASHNPRLYKEQVLGDYYLNSALPPTGAFF